MYSQLTTLLFLSVFGAALTISGSTSGHLNRHHAIRQHIADQAAGSVVQAEAAPAPRIRRRGSGKSQHCAAQVADVTVAAAAKNVTTTTTAKPKVQEQTTTTTKAAATTTAASSSGGGSGKTYSGGDATYYGIGLGACGETSKEPELIAAMAFEMFDGFAVTAAQKGNPNLNPVCGRSVTATLPGYGSVTVRIVDRCAGCMIKTSLDFSMAAFDKLTNGQGEAKGRIHELSWQFND